MGFRFFVRRQAGSSKRISVSLRISKYSYTVVRGDTLYSIARRFGVNAAQIARHNNMSLSSTLLTGMELQIPGQQID